MVAIILSSYNGEKFISEQINSIINQSYKDWVLHVFDDCSHDRTEQIVNEYSARMPEKIFFHKSEVNSGSTVNFLKGVKSLVNTADYYMFCDQDDVWLIDKIEVTLKFIKRIEKRFKRKNKPVLVFTDALLVDENLGYLGSSFYKTSHLKAAKTDLSHLLMENKCIGCTSMFNNALTQKVEAETTGIRYHDWWLSLIGAAFGVVKYCRIPTIMYRQHSSNQVGQNDFGSYVRKRKGHSSDIEQRLSETYSQAASFYNRYSEQLKPRKRKQIFRFTRLPEMGCFKKRFTVLRYRYLKSGLIRNLGLLFYI